MSVGTDVAPAKMRRLAVANTAATASRRIFAGATSVPTLMSGAPPGRAAR